MTVFSFINMHFLTLNNNYDILYRHGEENVAIDVFFKGG